MANGKHASNQKESFFSLQKIIGGIITILVIILAFFGGKYCYSKIFSENHIDIKDNSEANLDEIPCEYNGYKVLGKLVIKNRNYSQLILENQNDNNITEETNILKNGLVKLYGNNLNEKGNFTIIGHNEENGLEILSDLNQNDEFVIKTIDDERKYIITEKYVCEPNELKSLMPNNNYIEITLITCDNGSSQRLVVKALEEKSYEDLITKTNELKDIVENEEDII